MTRLEPIAKFVLVTSLLCLGVSLALGQNNVLTHHNDIARSGLNPNETLLTPANVKVSTFGKLFAQTVDGIIVGQPLYASNVLMNDGNVHNVVYVATQNNTVYAFDADSTQGNNVSPLWSVSLNGGATPDPIADYGCTGLNYYTEIGIMGTPVIDPGVTTLYVVAKTVAGSGNTAVRNFSLHALDVRTGNELLGGPVVVTGTAQSNNGSGTFNPIFQMQRPALLLDNSGVLYIGFGGNGCDEYAYNGWLFTYNSQNLQQESAFLVTPDGKAASIWQGGAGPAVDENGYVYVATANGTYDGASGNDYGDSVLKFGWNANVFGIVDYFTPYNQKALAQEDLDLGSAGPLILPDQPGLYPHEMIAGGKQGTLYLINRDNMGQFNATTDNVIQEIPKAVKGELTGVPTYWNNSVYVAGDGDYIKQFGLNNGLLTQQPISQTSIFFGGLGPASTSISANGSNNAILWAVRHGTPALFAYDPTNLANEFYDSTQATQLRDKLVTVARFTTPTISNGKVYVGGTTALEVYGLLPALSVAGGNNQTGMEKSVLSVPITALASDAYGSRPLVGVSVTCKDGGVGGVFTPSGAQNTNTSGTVSYSYQLPVKPLAVTITCTSTGYASAVFDETSTVGPPQTMTLTSGNNQTAPPNAPLPALLVVKIADAHGYAISGVTVNFTDNGAGGTFASTSVVTGTNGTASAQYTTGVKAAKVTITASSSGLKNLTFSEMVVAGPPANIAITNGNNQTAPNGTKLPQPLTVLVTDQYSNPVSGVSVNFNDGGAGGTFSNPNPVATNSSGTASQSYTLPAVPNETVDITATATGVSGNAIFIENGR